MSKVAAALVSAAAWAASLLPLSAAAQTAVTDPCAPVPSVVYQSVFNVSPVGVETRSDDWKKANAEVAQFPRGHVDILKWEEGQIKAKAADGRPAKPALPAAAAAHKH